MNKYLKGLFHPVKAYRYFKRKSDYAKGIAPPPKSVNIQPTLACNLKCRMCTQHMLVDPKSEIYRKMLSMDHLKKTLDEVQEYKPFITLIGGEPMLHPQIKDMIIEIKKRELGLLIITNGIRLKETAKFLIENKVDMVFISLDGREEINDSNRGKGSFKTATEGIRELVNIKKEMNLNYPQIRIIATISDLTYSDISDIGDIGLELGVDGINLSHLQFFTESEMQSQIKCTQKLFSDFMNEDVIKAVSEHWENYKRIKLSSIDADVLLKQLDILRKKTDRKINLESVPDYNEKEIKKYYTDAIYRRPSEDKCKAVYESISLSSTGEYFFCMGYTCGRVEDVSFSEIWNSENTRKFRLLAAGKSRLPVCHRCCN